MNAHAPTDEPGHLFELELVQTDPSCPFVTVASELDCSAEVIELVPSPEETNQYRVFVRIDDASPDSVRDLVRRSDELSDLRTLKTVENELLGVVTITGGCITPVVHETATVLQSARADGDEHRLVVTLPPDADPEAVIDTLREDFPELSVRAVRDRPVTDQLLTKKGFQTRLEDRLTDRQWSTLELAFQDGYFLRPREITQVEMADRLDLSQETISQHLRAAQQNLFGVVFDEMISD